MLTQVSKRSERSKSASRSHRSNTPIPRTATQRVMVTFARGRLASRIRVMMRLPDSTDPTSWSNILVHHPRCPSGPFHPERGHAYMSDSFLARLQEQTNHHQAHDLVCKWDTTIQSRRMQGDASSLESTGPRASII